MTRTTTETKQLTEPSLETLAELFKEQLRLLGRLLVALRNMRPPAKQEPELVLEPEVAATD